MPDAIGPSRNLPPHIPPSTDVPALAKKLQDQISNLAESFEKTLEDPSLSDQASFLHSIAENVTRLHQVVEEALTLR